jgi:trehalose-phosphatase
MVKNRENRRTEGEDNLKVSGLFLDYDGTLSPLNVSRQQSRTPPHIEALLNVIRRLIPISIISTKDLSFILPRTLFAHAWGAIAGLEMKIGSQLFTSEGVAEGLPFLDQALNHTRQYQAEGIVIEEKRNSACRPLAFCVDWRQIKNEKLAKSISSQIMTYCKSLPLHIIEYPGQPYFDVFPCPMDKGMTLAKLRERQRLPRGILYMGDSITDNAAFQEADISIGVTGWKKPVDLDCRYWIKFAEVGYFFSFLLKNNFVFSPDLPGIRERR